MRLYTWPTIKEGARAESNEDPYENGGVASSVLSSHIPIITKEWIWEGRAFKICLCTAASHCHRVTQIQAFVRHFSFSLQPPLSDLPASRPYQP